MEEKQVFLDGKLVKESNIDSRKHTFIGNFRSPTPLGDDLTKAYAEYFLCNCGKMLQLREQIRTH